MNGVLEDLVRKWKETAYVDAIPVCVISVQLVGNSEYIAYAGH